ncbi:site-2 protease family protein [Nocardiopsis sediminis]|uniref:Site-2 protease family protein n=1 Tax=Nocardiopsis sediminis TaxID=1778267 RepID=A0ABV8FM06_9ACTN
MSTPEPTEPDDTRAGEGAPASAIAPERPGTNDDAAAPDAESAPADSEGDAGAGGDGGSASGPGRADLLPSPVFVLLLGITGLAGWFSWTRAEVDWTGDDSTVYLPFVFILFGWIVSLALHEFGHALAAYRFGDRGLRGGGYLRLNPFAYRGLFAGLLMPVAFLVLGGVGLPGPAPHDPSAVRGRAARSLAALAGIAVNLLLAVALAAAVAVLVPADMFTDNWMLVGLMYLCYLNLTAALLNVLPVPGLDGFAALSPYLPERVAGLARTWGLFGVIALFAVLWLPQVNLAFLNAMLGLFGALGLPQMDIGFGEILFRFWVS